MRTTQQDPAPDSVRSEPHSDATRHKTQIHAAIDLLERIGEDRSILASVDKADQRRLVHAAGKVWSPDETRRRQLTRALAKQRRAEAAQRGEEILNRTGIRTLRRKPTFTTPNVYPPSANGELAKRVNGAGTAQGPSLPDRLEPHHCYVCKKRYSGVHHFYDQMCLQCAELNYRKRGESTDLSGRVALLTGGRVKIGYQAGIKLLRCGAELIVTTRFPRDAAARYSNEKDFKDWGHRLQIRGLDLRHTPSVEAFCRELLETRHRLDFIINNACQTVRRPPEFYAHMMEGEAAALDECAPDVVRLLGPQRTGSNGVGTLGSTPDDQDRSEFFPRPPAPEQSDAPGLTHSAQLSQLPLLPDERFARPALFPVGELDQDLQQVDLRETNSWRMLMADVPTVELLEVQLVNAVAPFVLNARLKPLMLQTENRDKHIVNVSAVEGQFYRNAKTTRHPHTNMAKAALNMMTRTAATDYHNDGIHMNAVDTGWVTDEDPEAIAARKTAMHRFHPPLDIVDGAARIVDPIIGGVGSGNHVWGQFLKNYTPTDW